MILVESLTKLYGGRPALDGVSFTVPPGQICGYLGPNGAGKSTTLKILCGMVRPNAGRASVAGFDVVQHALEAKRRIGFAPESAALYGALTPREYLTLVCDLFALDPDAVPDRIERYLRLFGLLAAADERTDTLSKGMRQKLVLASALIHDPPVILLDEPLDGLDVHAVRLVKELLVRAAGEGRTVLYSSHLLDVVERLCDRVIILDRGRIVADATPRALRDRFADSSLEDVFRALTTSADEQRLVTDLIAALPWGAMARDVPP